MSSPAYPAFLYRTDDGFRISFPDFPAMTPPQALTVSEVGKLAAVHLEDELRRLEAVGRAAPAPSDPKALVSVRGGRVIVIQSGGDNPLARSRPLDGSDR